MPPELSAFIAARIAGYAAEAADELQWQSPFVAQFAALPLYLGWTETIGLRPDGQLIRWSTEGDYAGMRPIEDRIWMLSALVAGAQRYAELRALLPKRPPGAVDCPCRKHPLLASGKVLCDQCGGIGWLLTPSQG
jgi:hypothetical protein